MSDLYLPDPPPSVRDEALHFPMTPEQTGVKYDAGKLDWTLLPWSELRQVVEVLDKGARKYAPDNWKRVPGARGRYEAAFFRHVVAYLEGEKADHEWGTSHLAHAICCLLFLMWLDNNGEVKT